MVDTTTLYSSYNIGNWYTFGIFINNVTEAQARRGLTAALSLCTEAEAFANKGTSCRDMSVSRVRLLQLYLN